MSWGRTIWCDNEAAAATSYGSSGWAAASLERLPSFIQFQQIVHLNYLRTLPALSTLALVAPIVWLVMLRGRRSSAEFKVVLVATIAVAIGFTITFVFNVPVNDQLETWNFAAPPSNAREIWSQWEKAHVIRTIFWVAGFLLEIVAVAVAASRRDPLVGNQGETAAP
jgi:FtsH-binding integral membrane protein